MHNGYVYMCVGGQVNMSDDISQTGGEPQTSTQLERVERVLEGLVRVAETRTVEERQRNPDTRRSSSVVEQFYKKKPTIYEGEPNPMKADFWLMDMERIFRIVECDDTQKIMCAADTLKEEAQNWWRSMLRQGVPTTWKQFTEAFRR